MTDILALIRDLLELFLDLGRCSSRRLAQPMLTVGCLAGAYTALQVAREGTLTEGVRAAFLDTETSRSERRRLEEQTTMQAELRQFAAANKLIDQLLETVLSRSSGASRVRLSVIHNGITGLTGTGLLRYDVTNSVAALGRDGGGSLVNQPLSDWSDFLPRLIAGQCVMARVAELRSVSLRARFEAFGASAVLVCPAADVEGKVLGAVFVFWDGADPVPDGEDLRRLMALNQHLSAQIAAVLDLRPAPSSR